MDYRAISELFDIEGVRFGLTPLGIKMWQSCEQMMNNGHRPLSLMLYLLCAIHKDLGGVTDKFTLLSHVMNAFVGARKERDTATTNVILQQIRFFDEHLAQLYCCKAIELL